MSYSYDGSGNLQEVTDVNGGDTDFVSDGSHRITLMRMPNYHSDGSLPGSGPSTCSSTPTSHAVNNHYDGSGRVDCQSRCWTSEDGNGVTTTNTYDANGNLLTTSRPLTGTSDTATNCKSPSTAVAMAQVTCYTYGNGTYPGDVTQMADPNGKVTYYHYDGNGYQDEVKDPVGNVSGTVRNNDGWVTATYSPKASCTWNSSPPTGCSATYKTTISYVDPDTSATNEFGDPAQVTDQLSHTTVTKYDGDRNKTSVKDPDGNTTSYAYDPDDRPTTTTRPDSTTIVTAYNDDGTVHTKTDGASHTLLTYAYNAVDEVTSTTDALSNVTSYTYDGVGNVLTKKDPVSGATCTGTKVGCTTRTYDADNELKTVAYSDSSSENVTATTYDSDGQRTGMTDGTGSSSWAYDSLHRITSYTDGNGDTVSYDYTYGGGPSYDLKDQVRSITYPNSVGTVDQSWNDDGTLASVEDWNSKTTTFAYDANANETGQTVPSTTNVTDTFGFNAADQMTSVSDSNGSTLFSATYTRDSNGQLSSDSSQAANQQNYKYTSLNQLCYAGSSTSSVCGSPPASSYPYAFNSADDLTTIENAGHTGTNTQQFNNADELCWTVSGSSANSCGSAPTGATTYGYDNKGNRTSTVPSAGSATCDTYDQANRLAEIQTGTGSSCTSPTTVGTYAYDGTGLRASKTVSGTTTHYTWDGAGGSLLQEKAGSTTTSYIYGPGGLPVEQIVGTTTTYLHHDQLGSTVLVTDSAGATGTATTNTFDPYGNQISTSGSLTTNLMYTGQYLDSESGLYYNRARYYDPTTAQFLTLDPMVDMTLSPYAYVNGNPLNATDATGLDGCSITNPGACASDIGNAAGAVGNAIGTGASDVGHAVGNAAGDVGQAGRTAAVASAGAYDDFLRGNSYVRQNDGLAAGAFCLVPGTQLACMASDAGLAATGEGSWSSVALDAPGLLAPVGGRLLSGALADSGHIVAGVHVWNMSRWWSPGAFTVGKAVWGGANYSTITAEAANGPC